MVDLCCSHYIPRPDWHPLQVEDVVVRAGRLPGILTTLHRNRVPVMVDRGDASMHNPPRILRTIHHIAQPIRPLVRVDGAPLPRPNQDAGGDGCKGIYLHIVAEVSAELCALAKSDLKRRFTQLTSLGMCRSAWMTLFL